MVARGIDSHVIFSLKQREIVVQRDYVMKSIFLIIAFAGLLHGCSVLTIIKAPDAEYDLAVLKSAGIDKQTMTNNFGDPVETITYTSPTVMRRDLHEYQVGIKHKLFYSLLSGSAAIYTLGITELSALPVAVEAAQATDSLRVYYGPDNKVYGSASYTKKTNMWLPNYIEHEENFRNGFPCYDFSSPSRKAMADYLTRKNRPDLAQKISNCLNLERVQVANQ